MVDLYEIVMKLTGPIYPIGETNEDNKRYHKLMEITELAEHLIQDIEAVIPNKDRPEFSMKRAGDAAKAFFDDNGIELDR